MVVLQYVKIQNLLEQTFEQLNFFVYVCLTIK